MTQLFYRGPSFAELHETCAKIGRIDQNSPIQTTSKLVIDAPIQQVWANLINLSQWPQIDSSFRNVRLETTVEEDAEFKFVLNHFPIKAKFGLVQPRSVLSWTGVSLWFRAVDLHHLETTAHGGTRYSVSESFSGILATMLISDGQLKRQHDAWLAAFKRYVENASSKGKS